jgi:hypothetical protein
MESAGEEKSEEQRSGKIKERRSEAVERSKENEGAKGRKIE